MRAALLALILPPLLAGCPRPPPPALAPPPPRIEIPEGCARDLSGRYVHARDPTFRYQGEDDGGTLTLALQRPEAGDGGAAPLRIVLHRTSQGFLGLTRASAFNAAHHRCPLDVPTEVTACPDAGLTLSTFDRIELDADCGFSLAKAERIVEPLVRLDAGAPGDAGLPGFK